MVRSLVVALCVLTAGAAIQQSTLLGLVRKSTSPSALAATLVESSTSLETSSVCNEARGQTHCEKCAMPTIRKLIGTLIKVKLNTWKTRSVAKIAAAKTCTELTPGARPKGFGKCCSALSVTYHESGYTRCPNTATFVPAATNLDPTKLKRIYGSNHYRWTGKTHSTMITDCCKQESVCDSNEKAYTTQMDTRLTSLNSLILEKKSLVEKNQALELQASKLKGEHAKLIASARAYCVSGSKIQKMCQMDGKSKGGLLYCVSKCTSGQIYQSLKTASEHAAKVTKDAASLKDAIKVLSKILHWLNAGTDKSGAQTLFSASSHDTSYQQNAPTPAAMVAFLESKRASSTSKAASAALEKAMSLLQTSQSSTAGRSAGSNIKTIFLQLISRLEQSRIKMSDYAINVAANSQHAAQAMMDKMVALEDLASSKLTERANKLSQHSKNTHRLTIIPGEETSMAKMWFGSFSLREANVDKCIKYMAYFDQEQIITTSELLMLKRVIDILRQIKCDVATPTTYPTAFPTTSPTTYPTTSPTTSPTTYPTASPTQSPTANPTRNVCDGKCCAAGQYSFMQKAFTMYEDEKYYSDPRFLTKHFIPKYAQGVKYRVTRKMSVGECHQQRSVIVDWAGVKRIVTHQMKCCSSGGLYGSIGTEDICKSKHANYCPLLGANMYDLAGEDPSAPNAAQHYSAGQIDTDVCPAGSTKITTYADCKNAGLQYNYNLGSATPVSQANQPRGCYAVTFGASGGTTYFNDHATGAATNDGQTKPLCKVVV